MIALRDRRVQRREGRVGLPIGAQQCRCLAGGRRRRRSARRRVRHGLMCCAQAA
eukprot:COSAG04_NODE_23975_length_329_cov_0.739130_1_plen_53_part_10